jgi:hypothetical protein
MNTINYLSDGGGVHCQFKSVNLATIAKQHLRLEFQLEKRERERER